MGDIREDGVWNFAGRDRDVDEYLAQGNEQPAHEGGGFGVAQGHVAGHEVFECFGEGGRILLDNGDDIDLDKNDRVSQARLHLVAVGGEIIANGLHHGGVEAGQHRGGGFAVDNGGEQGEVVVVVDAVLAVVFRQEVRRGVVGVALIVAGQPGGERHGQVCVQVPQHGVVVELRIDGHGRIINALCSRDVGGEHQDSHPNTAPAIDALLHLFYPLPTPGCHFNTLRPEPVPGPLPPLRGSS